MFKLLDELTKRVRAIELTVNKIWATAQVLQTEELKVMANAQQIIDKVTEVQGAEDSTVALLDLVHAELVAVKEQLVQAGADATALDGVMTMLDSSKVKLGDAVARNPLPV